jgi:5-methylcytosine-specific restriction endonuclease McrA
MPKTEVLFHLIEEHRSVEKVAEILGEEKCVLRAQIRHIPHLHKRVQQIMQQPYRPALIVDSLPQYKKRLRGDLCAYCGEYSDQKMTIDHIEPTSMGGSNTVDNITAACAPCNSRKSNTDLLTFMLAERD